MILSFLECNEHYLNLENRPNKTPAEQQKLTDKKEQLIKLKQPINNQNDLPWGKIGLGC